MKVTERKFLHASKALFSSRGRSLLGTAPALPSGTLLGAAPELSFAVSRRSPLHGAGLYPALHRHCAFRCTEALLSAASTVSFPLGRPLPLGAPVLFAALPRMSTLRCAGTLHLSLSGASAALRWSTPLHPTGSLILCFAVTFHCAAPACALRYPSAPRALPPPSSKLWPPLRLIWLSCAIRAPKHNPTPDLGNIYSASYISFYIDF